MVDINPEELPEGEAKVQAVRAMFDVIAPRYDLVNRVMTLRLDVGWRRKTVRRLLLGPGSLVLDLACGTGDFLPRAAGLRPDPHWRRSLVRDAGGR